MRSRRMTLCMVNYNGERYLPQTLGTVWAQGDVFAEIIVIDDASRDGSVQLIHDRFPEVRIVRLPENRGPASARNAGFHAAAHDLILFIDNDVTVGEGCPEELARALEADAEVAATMPRILYASNPDTIYLDGAGAHFLGLMVLHHVNTPLHAASREVREIGSLATGCFLFDRARWGTSLPFDETFLFNYEDHDLGLRCRAFGHSILSVPSAVCYHGEGTPGLSVRGVEENPRLRVYCLIRDRWQILVKTYQVRTLVLLSPILLVYEVFQFAGVLRKGWLTEWVRAVGWILRNAGVLLRKRAVVQKNRVVPDRGLLQGGPLPFREVLARGRLERLGVRLLDRLAAGYWRLVLRMSRSTTSAPPSWRI